VESRFYLEIAPRLIGGRRGTHPLDQFAVTLPEVVLFTLSCLVGQAVSFRHHAS
jgi:hypothetical protein